MFKFKQKQPNPCDLIGGQKTNWISKLKNKQWIVFVGFIPNLILN